jgi:hypothetical protein
MMQLRAINKQAFSRYDRRPPKGLPMVMTFSPPTAIQFVMPQQRLIDESLVDLRAVVPVRARETSIFEFQATRQAATSGRDRSGEEIDLIDALQNRHLVNLKDLWGADYQPTNYALGMPALSESSFSYASSSSWVFRGLSLPQWVLVACAVIRSGIEFVEGVRCWGQNTIDWVRRRLI